MTAAARNAAKQHTEEPGHDCPIRQRHVGLSPMNVGHVFGRQLMAFTITTACASMASLLSSRPIF